MSERAVTLPPPTDDIARLVGLIGASAALKLIEKSGGTRVYVGEAAEGRVLTRVIGIEAARALAEHYKGEAIKVPVARSWRILCYAAMGLTRIETALRAGCSENTVFETLNRLGRPELQHRQFDLFLTKD